MNRGEITGGNYWGESSGENDRGEITGRVHLLRSNMFNKKKHNEAFMLIA